MANEAVLQVGLRIQKGNLSYQSLPQSFTATVTGSKGPTPGAITVTTAGVNVDLSGLTTPGLCRLMNLDSTNVVEWGVHDGSIFHPVGEMLPGESYVIRFSRNLLEEEDVPGTGTTADINAFMLRAVGGSCICLVECFET